MEVRMERRRRIYEQIVTMAAEEEHGGRCWAWEERALVALKCLR